ncbi:MAG: HEAT repeat domain-containing protein [Planctomycetota bacterium]|nr:HEAT repeat domain-containing protein [Planctomycetota bacterium]
MKHPILTAGVFLVGLAGVLAATGCGPKPGDAPQTGWWNAPSEADLVKLATDPTDPDKRRQGVNGLGKLSWGGAGRHAALFVERLEDEDNNVRSAAIRALAPLGQAQYLPVIVAKLDDRSPMVRDDAAFALDALHGDAAVAPLQVHATSDGSPAVRGRCARALQHYPTKEVQNTLVGCLKDDNFGVRYEAHESLKAITKRDFEYDAARWNDYVGGRDVAPPGAKGASKPWWNLAGADEPKPTTPTPPPATAVDPTAPVSTPPPAIDYPIAPAPPQAAPAAPAKKPYQRPSWDWLGVTVPKDEAPAANAGASGDSGEKPYQRPSWDWLGVTVPKNNTPPAPKAPAPNP